LDHSLFAMVYFESVVGFGVVVVVVAPVAPVACRRLA
jgi:hypothetical protein